jgi:hypothetical protein
MERASAKRELISIFTLVKIEGNVCRSEIWVEGFVSLIKYVSIMDIVP